MLCKFIFNTLKSIELNNSIYIEIYLIVYRRIQKKRKKNKIY